jgi:DNA-binding MarR family transcriptional regulator
MERLSKRLQTVDLRVSDASVLMVIEANERISQSEVGRLLNIAGANMAPLVNRLEARKLLVRSPVDGRTHTLSLSGPGRALLLQVQQIVKAHERELLDKIPAQDRSAFMRILQAIGDD